MNINEKIAAINEHDTKIVRALAKFMGWREFEEVWIEPQGDLGHARASQYGPISDTAILPGYTQSLDDVSDVRAKLTPDQVKSFMFELYLMVCDDPDVDLKFRRLPPCGISDTDVFALVNSTAEQQALAVCRALWPEDFPGRQRSSP